MFFITLLGKHAVQDNAGFLTDSSKLHTVSLTTNTFIQYHPFLARRIGNSSNSRSVI